VFSVSFSSSEADYEPGTLAVEATGKL